MAKIKIAQNPTFTGEVKIPRVGGDSVPVGFEFRYMDRPTLAALFDGWNAQRDAMAAQGKADGWSWEASTAAEIQHQVEQIKAVVVGWDFDDEFGDEAIAHLVSTCTGAPRAVLEAYQAAYSPARAGN